MRKYRQAGSFPAFFYLRGEKREQQIPIVADNYIGRGTVFGVRA